MIIIQNTTSTVEGSNTHKDWGGGSCSAGSRWETPRRKQEKKGGRKKHKTKQRGEDEKKGDLEGLKEK